jgi:sugar/nucleoside kinase (ribokinase family)
MKRITQLEKRIQELKIKNRLKVVGIGNAIVDCLVRVSEDLLDELGLHKGAMTLISNEEVFELENIIKDLKVARASGGSVANTLATLGIFGVHSQFLGKVGDDEFGNFFIRDLAQYRVDSD